MPKILSQGTVSVIAGCHSPIHSILVVLAWRQLYGSWPKFWQLVCILLHDIGHIGKQYLDDFEQKKEHWILGARIARFLFGEKGYLFVAGHCSYSGVSQSLLYRPDKLSWLIAPMWWMRSHALVEPSIGKQHHIDAFLKHVRENVESGRFESNHVVWLKAQKQLAEEEKSNA
jgi:hypothetical protein